MIMKRRRRKMEEEDFYCFLRSDPDICLTVHRVA
jgi:hypothetical protein